MGKIGIKQLELFVKIGVTKEEKAITRKVYADIEIEYDIKKASLSDTVEDTFDYSIFSLAADAVKGKEFHLLEALAGRMGEFILNSVGVSPPGASISNLKIRLEKQAPFVLNPAQAVWVEWES